MSELVLDPRFNGPPGSGNGGYVCGVLAASLGSGPAQVRLYRPPPLGEPLALEEGRLLDGDAQVAVATPWTGTPPEIPGPVPHEVAAAATTRFRGHSAHPFPSCFGCGPDRSPGDGLRIFAGPVAESDSGLVAAPWTPEDAAGPGPVPTPIVWAALDCPGGWAVMTDGATFVLGSMLGHVVRPVPAGEALVVTAWPAAVQGRKRFAGSALHSAAGELLAWSHQTWIELN